MKKTYEAPQLILDQYVQDTMIASAGGCSGGNGGGGSRPSGGGWFWPFWPLFPSRPSHKTPSWQQGPGRH